jgi:perosamine synthetase
VAFRDLPGIVPPSVRDDVKPAWHLYPIRVDAAKLNVDRGQFLSALRSENIGVNIHYIPVHLHRYYREQFGYKGGEYPVAQRSYERLSSLPIFHGPEPAEMDRRRCGVSIGSRRVIRFRARTVWREDGLPVRFPAQPWPKTLN